PGSETVASFGDATGITSSGFGTAIAGFQNWDRPANAFDGDTDTAWLVAGLERAEGNWIKANFSRPIPLSEVVLTPHRAFVGARHVTKATIVFSDGSETPVAIGDKPTAEVRFSKRVVTSF